MNLVQNKDNLPATPLTKRPELPFRHVQSGKVRELYDLGDAYLILATDRVSAFNSSLPTGIPGKGILLTQISLFWFDATRSLVLNHLVPNHLQALQDYLGDYPGLIPRAMIVQKLSPIPIEAIVRAYLMGSGWLNYQETGQLYGHDLPSGLNQCDKLPTPLFTPTTKDEEDTPLTEQQAKKNLGGALFSQVKKASLDLFNFASKHAQKVNLTLVDTKFEFGLDSQNNLVLIDEALTPDSSRYWASDDPEKAQFDKQFLRNFLLSSNWNKQPPAPEIPADIVKKTQERYLAVYEKLLRSSN